MSHTQADVTCDVKKKTLDEFHYPFKAYWLRDAPTV